MADNTVNTSITISFQSLVDETSGEGALKLEVEADDQVDGDTTFEFGDAPIFRQYKTSNVSISERILSDDNASVGQNGSGTKSVEDEIVTFSNSNTASTTYPIKDGTLSVEVVGGNVGSSFIKSGPSEIKATNPTNKDHPIGVCKVSYSADFTKWKLSGVTQPSGWPTDESYPVLIYVFGIVVAS